MSIFKYYVSSMFGGVVYGTNDDDEAASLAEDEDNYVVDSTTGEWLCPGKRISISEAK